MYRHISWSIRACLAVAMIASLLIPGPAFARPTTSQPNVSGAPYSKVRQSLEQGMSPATTILGDYWRLNVWGDDASAYGWYVSLSGDRVGIGGPTANFNSRAECGGGVIWQLLSSSALQIGDFTGAAGTESLDHAGWSVAVSADTFLIAAVDDDSPAVNAGSVRVYYKPGSGSWVEQTQLTASDAEASDWFGCSVAISGDTAVVGALGENGQQGAAYVFVRDGGGVWTQQQKLVASDGAASDNFGFEVSISGDTVAVGTPHQTAADTGAVYVFTRSGVTWTQQAKITASDAQADDYFGNAVSVDGDTLAVGANADDDYGTDSGAAYVFTRTGGIWTQQAKLHATPAASLDYFGASVSVSGDRLAVGAPYTDKAQGTDVGAAYVFGRQDGAWSQLLNLPTLSSAAEDYFGWSVSMSGSRVAVGAPFAYDLNMTNYPGAAYVFGTREVSAIWQSVYRFYRPSTGTHFYTASEAEMNSVKQTLSGTYSYEGVGYSINVVNPDNCVPLYRFYNRRTGTHLYTADPNERNTIINNLSAIYSLDGIAYNVSLTAGMQVHRFYSPSKGVHFYSSDPNEIAYVRTNLAGTWQYEGPAYMVGQ